MPHILIQATPKLSGRIDVLGGALHEAALACGHFPDGGVRTIAQSADFGLCGPRAWGADYVQVLIRIAPGRSVELVDEIADTLFAAMKQVVEAWRGEGLHIGYQMEVTEFDKTKVRSGGVLSAP
ncbi:hypothetical protein RMR16_023950 (plasmid) [Agrobacterium sp. rho-13.3]|uniref:hypothetical protein n=1 Tax=Agrobacterium sp. rho-13.3 TaxID=3072980 RepID=UPI002A0CFF2B|nr:hypothetical protein [Agrobacterium sp. rho-13.3]MDX8312044.1 hypothetical protein [Agrobacterium sp. rho-13.3]